MNKNVTVIRAEHSTENPYFLMARKTAQDERISFEARGLLAYLLSKPDDWKITVYDLCQNCGRSRIYRILKELRSAGYIEYERKSGGRGKWEHIYKIHELSRVENTDVKNTDVKVTRVKKPRILHIQTPEITDSTKKRKDKKETPPSGDTLAITDLIKAWLDANKAINPKAYGKTNRDYATAMFKAGITPDDVTSYVTHAKKDKFYADKAVSLPTVAQNIQSWKTTHQRPAPAASDEPTPEQVAAMPDMTPDDLAIIEALADKFSGKKASA